MSGHSKWSKVKHQKAVTDVVKGLAFTKASRAITIAVKEGGGIADPEKNFRLRLAVDQARSVNMPKENIERAIEKAVKGSGNPIEEILYEGYAPGGIALLIETATDNRQRTVSQVKNVLDKAGGALAAQGAVAYLFTRTGCVVISSEETTLDSVYDLAIPAGAFDIMQSDGGFEVYFPIVVFEQGKNLFKEKGFPIVHTELLMLPTVTVMPPNEEVGKEVETLVESLESLDDVMKVYTNRG